MWGKWRMKSAEPETSCITPGGRLLMKCSSLHSRQWLREVAEVQLQHHAIRASHLAEVGAGAADGCGADEQGRRQLDQRRWCIEQPLGLQHELVAAQGDATAQLVAVGGDAGADRRRQPAEAVAGIAVQHDLAIELLAGAGEDGDRVPARRARALVEGMAAVAMQCIVAAGGLEGPAEELLAGGGVLGDQQDRADRGGTAEGAVDVGKRSAADGGIVVGAVAAVAGVVCEGAGQRVSKDRTAAGLGLPLGRGAFSQKPEVGRFKGMTQLPGVAPTVGGGIGMGADHREGSAGVAGQGVHHCGKSAEGPVELHADPSRILAGPLPAARREGLTEHLKGHDAVPPSPPCGAGASLVRSSRPWLPIASHSLPSGGL
jgi:hypothetical protein